MNSGKKARFLLLTFVAALSACGSQDTGLSTDKAQARPQKRTTQRTPSDYQTLVEELYVAYFGRPADPSGLANFENALLEAQAPTDINGLVTAYTNDAAIRSLVDSFSTSKESQALYGSGTADAFVTAIFQNVLGRAPQSSGLAYWSSAVYSGSLNQGDAALSIMAGALANNTAQGQLDTQLIHNRLSVAVAYTSAVSAQNVSSYYAGSAASASARNLLSQVDAATDTTSFQNTVDTAVAALLNGPGIRVLAGDIGGLGNVDGPASAARYNQPGGIARDSSGNLYIADSGNNVIRKMDASGNVSTLAGTAGTRGAADGLGAKAQFDQPTDVAVDSSGNVYVADCNNNAIRKISPAGQVVTLAGQSHTSGSVDGTGANAGFFCPFGVALDAAGNVYVADSLDYEIRKVTPTGSVTTLAGSTYAQGVTDGTGSQAQFFQPFKLTVDNTGTIYVADGGGAIRKVTQDGVVTTVLGRSSDPNSKDASGLGGPGNIISDGKGNLYVAEAFANRICKISSDGIRTIIAGGSNLTTLATSNPGWNDGNAVDAGFNQPTGLAFDASGNLIISDHWNHSLRMLSTGSTVSTISGRGYRPGSLDGQGSDALFNQPGQLALDSSGNIFVADTFNDTIREITQNGIVSTLAGTAGLFYLGGTDGLGPSARFYKPAGVAVSSAGNVYVADTWNGLVRMVTPAAVVTTFAGKYNGGFAVDGTGASAGFGGPTDMTIDKYGNMYVIDGQLIRKVTPQGVVTTLPTQPTNTFNYNPATTLARPAGIGIDGAGNLYVGDLQTHVVFKVTQGGVVSTYAGQPGVPGAADGTANLATFNQPAGIAVDRAGNVYVGDSGNSTIRKITLGGTVSTVAGVPGARGIVPGALPGGLSGVFHMTIDSNGILYCVSEYAILEIHLPPSQ